MNGKVESWRYDDLYSDSINDIALVNYNKGIARRLREQEINMENFLPFKQPEMLGLKLLGGIRPSNTIQYGTRIEFPSTNAVGGGAFKTFTGRETPAEGGKISRYKKANKYLGFSKEVADAGFDVANKGVDLYNKGIRGGLVYSQSLQESLNRGGKRGKKTIKASTTRPLKGSQEMKDKMAKIRMMRGKK